MGDTSIREAIAAMGESLHRRGYAHGSSGNISVRSDEGILITPTNSCLGRLDPARMSRVDSGGRHLDGDRPSKEAFLHLSMYSRRPSSRAIVHLHCTNCVAVSCLCHDDTSDVLPPITAYYVMKIGRLPLVPYFPPGDINLAAAVAEKSADCSAVLLANHGPVVAGSSLEDAVNCAEELEETARLFLILRGQSANFLTPGQVAALGSRFES